jgi:hypothetical protein
MLNLTPRSLKRQQNRSKTVGGKGLTKKPLAY